MNQFSDVKAAHENKSRVHSCVCIGRSLGETAWYAAVAVWWAGSHALMLKLKATAGVAPEALVE